MVDSSRSAITAVAHVEEEGFIAATLHRLGWSVVHRATSEFGLADALISNPSALLISSHDFRGIMAVTAKRHLRITKEQRGQLGENELQDLLRAVDNPSESAITRLPPTHSQVILVGSIGRSVGASTIALNLAQEIAEHSTSVLYLDCNLSHPYISKQLGINGVNRGIQRTNLGFSVGEVSQADNLSEMANSADSYNPLIIDFGQVASIEQLMRGKRLAEQVFAWGVQSGCDLVLVSKAESRWLDEMTAALIQCRRIIPAISPLVLLTLTSVLGGRERMRLREELSEKLDSEVRLISRDRKATRQMEDENSTLLVSAPKSILRSELRAVADECVKDREVRRA